ncbi:hypothetical protein AUC71_10705 [Methyloceanibacter marginalis]|uniref:Uncharacterized protein n=2 Tax=Methyloceanibacter marginalis TaxID=1774971 RepID=A0A1E3WBP6_9HYPH|nr:hypothetical protein AUC71_10705 [Methyloceanibacter marginalis]
MATVAAGRGDTPASNHPMPLSFGIFGKAIAIFMVVAFALWLIFTYVFASDEDADAEAERLGGTETPVEPAP